jgi:hypothetical protein
MAQANVGNLTLLEETVADDVLSPLLLAALDQSDHSVDMSKIVPRLRDLGLVGRDDTADLGALLLLLDPGTVHRHAVPALDHPDEEVVIAAIKLLVAEGRSDWLAPVGDRLLHHCHWEVRVNFARALAELQGESCRDLLENRLLVEDQDLVREQFQDLLAALQQPRR